MIGSVALGITLAGCGAHGTPQPSVDGAGAELFPSQTLQDWVSYADHVAVYRVVSERALPLGAEEKESGEGLAPREVTLQIERRLWTAPSAPRLPDEIRMDVFGWVLHDGERQRIEARGAPRVIPGDRYLAPLARVEFDAGPEWWPLTPAAQLPVTAGVVGTGGWSREITPELPGLSIDEAERVIDAANPDPIAAKLSELRPQERVQAVADRRTENPAEP